MFNFFWNCFIISISTFGGGSVMISLFQKEFVETGLISSDQFIKALALSQATPGPIAAGLGTYIGFMIFGIIGILIANIAIALPTILIVIVFSKIIKKYKENEVLDKFFIILRPVTIALIGSVMIYFINITVFNNAGINALIDLYNNFNISAFAIVIFSLFLIIKYKISPFMIVVLSGIMGGIFLN